MPWQGNVRELRNVVENLLLTGETVVSLQELGMDAPGSAARPSSAPLASLQQAEQDMIARALKQADGNIAEAARLLRISRSTLYRKIERYNLAMLIAAP